MPSPKFVQIACAASPTVRFQQVDKDVEPVTYAESFLFALDEDGDVWEWNFKTERWDPLPQ
jgi:hypothetical protein